MTPFVLPYFKGQYEANVRDLASRRGARGDRGLLVRMCVRVCVYVCACVRTRAHVCVGTCTCVGSW